MKILIYGAGPMGSLFAVRLHEAGHDVALLARGQRLHDLLDHGVVLQYGFTGARTNTAVPVVQALAPDDNYDLILVVMRKNQALEILPTLAANTRAPTMLFLMNNFAGPDALVRTLGIDRVMLGFPTGGGAREEHMIRVVPKPPGINWTIPVGEVDGRVTERTLSVAAVLESMHGYQVQVRDDMNAWLKYHVALLMPAFVPALYASGTDAERFARTRDTLVLAIRGTREAFRTLRRAGVPVTPSGLAAVEWLPEPVLLASLRKLITTQTMKISGEGHARAARDEMQFLTDEFRAFARANGAQTPVIDGLYGYYDPETPAIPDGRNEITLHWEGLLLATAALGAATAILTRKRAE
jgi:ketopantoate reductase